MTNPEGGPAGPVLQNARIDSIDVLRGFALLGILVMNIQFFAMPDAAYFNPTAYGDLEGANLNVWLGSRLLADQKFMTIFSMLFGAGIVLMSGRAAARGEAGGRTHYRRMGWLALIGLLHAHLLWAGDILFTYAICGMLVFPLRGWSPTRLLVVGTATVAVASVLFLAAGASLPYWPEADLATFTAQWRPTPELIDSQLAAYGGGWLDQLPLRMATALGFETLVLFFWGGWRAGGLMLIGMALFKLDVFSAQRSPRFYGALVAGALVAGIPVEAYGVALDFRYGWSVTWSFFQGRQFNYWPSIAVSLGYIGLVMLACRTAALRRITRPFAAIGQMALTNYLLQTVICTTIFYGHGLGLYGSVERTGQLAVVAGVWAVQLIVSPLWLQRFRFGPVEWVWRSLTYGTRPALRRAPAAATAA